MKGRRVYISGPMTGHPDLNARAFAEVQDELLGTDLADLYNPHWIAVACPTREEAMAWDLHRLTGMCSEGGCTVVLLPGWEESKGARLEREVALACGAEIIEWKGARDA